MRPLTPRPSLARFDFDTAEEYSEYKSKQEAAPKAAYQVCSQHMCFLTGASRLSSPHNPMVLHVLVHELLVICLLATLYTISPVRHEGVGRTEDKGQDWS